MTRKPKQKKETKKQKEEVVEVASEATSNEPTVREELNLGEKVKAELDSIKEEYEKLNAFNKPSSLKDRVKSAKFQLEVVKRQLDEKDDFTYEEFLKIQEENSPLYEGVMYYLDEKEKTLVCHGVDATKLKSNIKEIESSKDLSHLRDNISIYRLPLDRGLVKKTITKTNKKIYAKTGNKSLAQIRILSIDLEQLYYSLLSLFPDKNIAEHQRLFVSICRYIDKYVDIKFLYIENLILNINLSAENTKANTKSNSFRSQVEGLYSLLSLKNK